MRVSVAFNFLFKKIYIYMCEIIFHCSQTDCNTHRTKKKSEKWKEEEIEIINSRKYKHRYNSAWRRRVWTRDICYQYHSCIWLYFCHFELTYTSSLQWCIQYLNISILPRKSSCHLLTEHSWIFKYASIHIYKHTNIYIQIQTNFWNLILLTYTLSHLNTRMCKFMCT